MCDLCEPDISRIDGKIFEPTCGNGNFLVEILRRKLAKIKFKNQKQFEFEIVLALSNIYAVDIQADNVREARKRLDDIIIDFTSKYIKANKYKHRSYGFIVAIDNVLKRTVLIGNTLTQKSKLIFYDFKPDYKNLSFEISPYSIKEIEETYTKTKKATLQNIEDIFKEFESPPDNPKPKRKRKPKAPPENTDSAQQNLNQVSLF